MFGVAICLVYLGKNVQNGGKRSLKLINFTCQSKTFMALIDFSWRNVIKLFICKSKPIFRWLKIKRYILINKNTAFKGLNRNYVKSQKKTSPSLKTKKKQILCLKTEPFDPYNGNGLQTRICVLYAARYCSVNGALTRAPSCNVNICFKIEELWIVFFYCFLDPDLYYSALGLIIQANVSNCIENKQLAFETSIGVVRCKFP